jgi:aminomethyltransferase
METPAKTALYQLHEKLNGSIIDFHGTLLPVLYTSIAEEHEAVRTNMGFFDVSHMGNILVEYPSLETARQHLDYLLPNRFSAIVPGKVIYSTMLNERGTVIDDLLVMCLSETRFHIIVNAGNIQKDYEWISEHTDPSSIKLQNISSSTSIIALQGPNAWKLLSEGMGFPVADLKFFTVIESTWKEIPVTISRTGYTGEDGFEICIANENAYQFTRELMLKGEAYGLKACGLGSRDTLRLEAGLPLYGQDLDDTHSPLQSMVHWSVKSDKECDFIGKKSLLASPRESHPMVLKGFVVNGRAIPRSGMQILHENGSEAGMVTSGTYTPYLKKNIGIAYIGASESSSSKLFVSIRNRTVPIEITPLPFYRRKK